MSESNGSEKTPAHRKVYKTEDEAKAVKPPSDKFRIFKVTKGEGDSKETVGYTWASNVEGAIVIAARAAGYSAAVSDPKAAGPLTKEKVSGFLAAMSDEDRAILIRQYVPASSPSTVAPAPKGRGGKK
jgi:hypothetical protein